MYTDERCNAWKKSVLQAHLESKFQSPERFMNGDIKINNEAAVREDEHGVYPVILPFFDG